MNIPLDFTVDKSEPLSIARTPQGEVFFANGIDPIRMWNGRGIETQPAGFQAPTGTPTVAGSGSGSLTGTYVIYYRWKDADGKYSNFSTVSAEVTVTDVLQFDIVVPVDPPPERATHVQVYRNTSGGTKTFYLDTEVALTGPGQYNITSTRDDNSLSLQDAVPIAFSDGQTAAFRFTPPKAKRSVVWHRERMFYAGDTVYKTGHLETANGSGVITGVGTNFTESMVGRNLFFEGSATPRPITAVASTTSLTVSLLATSSSVFQRYLIQPDENELATVYWSYVNEAESVASTQSYVVDEDNDRITGLMVLSSELFIFKKHNTFRFPLQRDPFNDGQIYQSHYRGCISHRAWATVDGTAFIMDREGIYKFSGGKPEQISQPIQNYFRETGINWQMAKWFHAAALPYERTVRFYVTIKGSGLPRHAFCYNYETSVWWIEEYPFPVGSTALVEVKGHQRLVVGTDGFRVLLVGGNHLDWDGGTGSNNGTVTGSGPLSIIDTNAAFDATGLVGYPVSITRGAGKGQQRRIVDVDTSSGRIEVDNPWNVQPDTTSYYQVGGIKCEWRTPLWEEIGMGRQVRRFRLKLEPTATPNHIDVRTVYNIAREPDLSWLTEHEHSGMRRWIDDEDYVELVTDKTPSGVGYYSEMSDTHPGHNHLVVDGNRGDTGPRSYRWVGFDMRWITGEDGMAVYGVGIDGVM
jgi:hypothetical protein